MKPKRGVLLLLLPSLLVNLVLVTMCGTFVYRNGGVSYFSTKAQTIRFSGAYLNRVSTFERLPRTRGHIVFAGDSIIEQCAWNELFGIPILNRGIGGDTTVHLLNRIDEIVALKPSKVFLMIGINDIQYHAPIADTITRYEHILAKLEGCKVCILSPLPVNNHILVKDLRKTLDNGKVLELDRQIRALAAAHTIPFIDLYSHFVKDGDMNPEYTFDGIHPNGKGYLIFKEVVTPYL